MVQLHVPRFWKDRAARLDRAALVRISQNVLTCPTARCFNLLDTAEYFHTGRKVAYFGNGKQKRIERFGRKMWWVPILGGEFVLDRRLGYADGLMGGNLWFFGDGEDAALDAAMLGAAAIAPVPGVVMCFPGGIAGSGSKPGSDYSFSIASTYEKYCPLLQDDPDVEKRAARWRELGDGDHHQRPRPADHHRRHPPRGRRGPGGAGAADDLGRQLRRPARQEPDLPAPREAAAP